MYASIGIVRAINLDAEAIKLALTFLSK